jgi:hypothetical protein
MASFTPNRRASSEQERMSARTNLSAANGAPARSKSARERQKHTQRVANAMSALDRKAHARSRVSNGNVILPNLRDGRSLVVRRYRDIMNAIVVDQGGAEQISEARLQLVRRFSAAAVLAEQLETKVANGEAIDITEHALLSSTLVRIARQIGVNRIPRDVTPPSLNQYLAQQEAGT